jgi:hypothetical protein
MKTYASEVIIGDTIKSPFSPYWGEVKSISSTEKKITFHIIYSSVPDEDSQLLGKPWQYTFFKNTKIITL